jgi:hypothetical protein
VAWAALLGALDERAKATRYGPDDAARAAARLPARAARSLAAILSRAPAGELPAKLLAGNVALEAVRAALGAGAAAAAFPEILLPPAGGSGGGGGCCGASSWGPAGRGGGAAAWLARGFSVREALDAGAGGQAQRRLACVRRQHW